MTEAALGAKIEVPTLDGRSLLRVPPGTSSGQKLRLREKGVPSVRQHGKRGDLYVELQVVVPKPVDERVRNLLRELAELSRRTRAASCSRARPPKFWSDV